MNEDRRAAIERLTNDLHWQRNMAESQAAFEEWERTGVQPDSIKGPFTFEEFRAVMHDRTGGD